MAASKTSRFDIWTWGSGDDPFTRAQMSHSHDQIEALGAVYTAGLLAARPASGTARSFYLATDQGPKGVLFYWNGSEWVALNAYGTPSAATPGDSNTEGSALTVARSDHKHAMLAFAAVGTIANVGAAKSAGASNTYARGDHVHALAADSVTAGTIADGAIDAAALFAAGVVDAAALANNSVNTAEIVDGAVTGPKIAADAAITSPVLLAPRETWNITATPAGSTVALDVVTAGAWYSTTNATGNWTLNVRGDNGTTLASKVPVGQSITVIYAATMGTTGYYMTTLQVDGSPVTVKWLDGSAPSSQTGSCVAVYSIAVVRTAGGWLALGSRSSFS